MDSEEQKPVRRTRRSAKVAASPQESPNKPTTRKTKKKVVVMEVEVTDEEEVSGQANDIETTETGKLSPEPKKQDDTKVENNISEEETADQDVDLKKGTNNTDPEPSKENGSTCLVENVTNNEDDTDNKLSECKSEDINKSETSNGKVEKCIEAEEKIEEEIKSSAIDEEKTEREKSIVDKTTEDKIVDVQTKTEEISENKVEAQDSSEVETRPEVTSDSKTKCEEIVEEKMDTGEIIIGGTKTEEKSKEKEMTEKETKSKEVIEEKTNKEEISENKTKSEELQEAKPEHEVETEKIDKKVIPEENISMDVDHEKEEISEPKVDKKIDEDSMMETDEKDDQKKEKSQKSEVDKNTADPDTENISEDELPTVQAVKVPETEEVSDEELPGPKRAELPADTEVVSEDELPTVKKDATGKRKATEGEYDPCSPTSESETPAKKIKEDKEVEKEKEEKPAKPKKLPELDKFWKAVNDDPTDFTGWTYLLQYVDQENDMEAAREAYDAFLSHYPYCYGYWRKYADYEKRKGNKKKCEEVFERGLKAIPLSVDLWIHYLNYVKSTRQDDEEYVRSQFDRAISACGLEFRSDRLWDSYIKWETEGKRLQKVTAIFDKLLATPTQGYTAHFESFQEHVTVNQPNKVLDVDEFLAFRKEVKSLLKHDTNETLVDSDAPPGDEDPNKLISSDEETKLIRERIISIRRKIHKNSVTAVSARWNFEEGIKRPYFHVKPLERCQLKNWQDYLDFEIQHGDKTRTIVLFERCLIACALYEEFWLKFIHYLNSLKDDDVEAKIRDVYERACTIHHLKKPNLHLQWAIFEESHQNANRAAEILVNLEKSVPNLILIAHRRISLERRRGDNEKCCQLFEHYINNSKNKVTASYHAIKFSRFQHKVLKDFDKAVEILKNAITKDAVNPRLYLQLVDLTLQKNDVTESEVVEIFDSFLEKENVEVEQKVLFAQRKLEYLEDFGSDIQSVQKATEEYQKILKQSKDVNLKRKDIKTDANSSKKEKSSVPPPTQAGPYGPYGAYNPQGQGSYQYSGSQPQGQYNYQQYGQNEQYPYQNWQYPQGGYGGYNQWGSYGSGYGY